MKRKLRAVLVFLLVLLMLVSPMQVFAQVTISYGKVPCVSNLSELSELTVLFRDDEPCISVGDASLLSGYTFEGNAFFRSGEKIKVPSFICDAVEWVPFEEAMEALCVEVMQIDQVLICRGLEKTAAECLAIADEIMLTENYYRVTDTQGFAGNMGYIAASIYHIVSQGKYFSAVSGNMEQENYKSVVAGVVDGGGNQELLNLVCEGSSLLSKLNKLGKMEGDLSEDAFGRIVSSGAVSDSLAAAQALNKLTDPVGQFIGNLEDTDGVKFGDILSIKGFDLASQLRLYQYFDAVVNGGMLYADMFSYTFGPCMDTWDLYMPEGAYRPIYDVTAYCNSEDYLNLLFGYMGAEGELFAFSTMENLFDEGFLMVLTSPMGAFVIPLAQFVLREGYDFLCDDVSEKMDFIVESRCITNMQAGIMRLYREYRKDPDLAVNAKYAAMLYVRLAQYNYEQSVKSGVIEDSEPIKNLYEKALLRLAECTDRDLTIGFVDVDVDLRPATEMPPEEVVSSLPESSELILEEEDLYADPDYPMDEGNNFTVWVQMDGSGDANTERIKDRLWRGASFVEERLMENSEIWDARVLYSDPMLVELGEGGSMDWELNKWDGSGRLSVNDWWISDSELKVNISCTEYTVQLEIRPRLEFDSDGWDEWYEKLNWVYDWNGTLIDSNSGMTFAEGMLYALDQVKGG